MKRKTTRISDTELFTITRQRLLDGEAIEIEAGYVLAVRINFGNTTGGMRLRATKCKDDKYRRLYVP